MYNDTLTHDESEDEPERASRKTMRTVSQTNPHTGENFGDTLTFHRGTTVAADGGAADGAVEDDTPAEADRESASDDDADRDDERNAAERDADRPRMRDVDKTPPKGAPDPNAVHMRGGERPWGEEVVEE